jgi:Zn-dependent peptidase ImmA (M78 family)
MGSESGRLSDIELGERLRRAREAAKITQADAGKVIDAARTTVVAIEQGQRRIRIDELQKLAHAYGTSANALLRKEAIVMDLVPQFRRSANATGDAVERAIRLLSNLVRAEVELENALGIERVRDYPPERPLLPGDVRQQAEHDAQELRERLGLGPGPVRGVLGILDLHLGVRVFARPLDSKVAGLYAFDAAAGACMLFNANHPFERFSNSAWHETGHFLSTRRQLEVLTTDERFASREEVYADVFARAFLLPERLVRQQFASITAGQSHFTRRHVILLAQAFGVSREALVRRLEELKLVRRGTWDWFQDNGGITDEQAKQVLGELPDRKIEGLESGGLVPHRLSLLAREAWKRQIYSEGQLMRLLDLDHIGIREVLDDAESEEGEADEHVKILP